MAAEHQPQQRYGEAFWRAHHEGWKRSDLNQREYCEAQGIPLKAFGNWRAKFKAEPQPPERKLLYRRRGLTLQLLFLKASESMGNHDSEIVGACSVD